MNITDQHVLHGCTSCQMCAAVCPVLAIEIKLDKEGFYRPFIDEGKCIDCSLCTKVCYKYNEVSMTSDEELERIDLLAASANEAEVLETTTSGGVAYLLAKDLFEQGYKCIGVVYDTEHDDAKHLIANSSKDIEDFRGSKYIQSYTYTAFRQLVGQCKSNEKTVVFGTPCQIYAIDRFLRMRKKRDNYLLVDIYCHGCPSLSIWQKYVHEIKSEINKKRFDKVDFRSKIKGWGSFYVVVVVDGVRAFVSSRKKDEFYQLFFSDYMLNPACSDCQLRSTLDYTDIRLGDFWGKCYDDNSKGVSAVTLVTDRGHEAFERIKGQFSTQKHVFRDFLPYQSWGKIYQPNSKVRQHLFDLLQTNVPLKELLHYYQAKLPLKAKIKRHLKSMVSFCSPDMIRKIKKIYHHF